jgi:hypothetical protein
MDSIYQQTSSDSIKNQLPYLYMIKSEFIEVNKLISTLKNYEPFRLDVRESTPIQNALNIAVVISYARNFKLSRGFNKTKDVNEGLISNFTNKEIELHNRLIDDRDKEFAHSDAEVNDIQIYTEGIFRYSRKTVRQLLEKKNWNNYR